MAVVVSVWNDAASAKEKALLALLQVMSYKDLSALVTADAPVPVKVKREVPAVRVTVAARVRLPVKLWLYVPRLMVPA